MKSYKEMADSVFERSNEIIRVKKRKKKIVTSVSCCFAAVLLGIGVMSGTRNAPQTPPIQNITAADTSQKSDDTPQESDAVTDKSVTQTQPVKDVPNAVKPDSDKPVKEDSNRLHYYMNPIISELKGSPPYRDPKLHYNEKWDNKKTADYFGIDLSKISPKLKYTGSDTHTVTFSNDGKLVEDRCAFTYTLGGGKVTVLASKLAPPYDCIYQTSENKATDMQGVDILMMYRGNNEDGYELNVADFEFNSVYYRVRGENVNFEDFHTEVILNILNNR